MNRPCTKSAVLLLGAVLIFPLAAGCARSRAATGKPAAPAAAFSPEGRWRSGMLKGMIMTVRLQPDGTLLMVDPHGHPHPFRRVGPDRWEARLSPMAMGSVHRDGDQLVFREDPTPESRKPTALKNGLMTVNTIKPIEDRMTRVADRSTAN